jgi:hypothetical protein
VSSLRPRGPSPLDRGVATGWLDQRRNGGMVGPTRLIEPRHRLRVVPLFPRAASCDCNTIVSAFTRELVDSHHRLIFHPH